MYKIIQPTTSSDFNQYYYLRWVLLRRPLGGKRGTERDQYEHKSFHLMIKDSTKYCVGVGRIHQLKKTAQIRYMAVARAARVGAWGA